MCRRPSRSLNSTVTALIRFSSVRYLSRSSWIFPGATCLVRWSLALRFSSSNSAYDRLRKSCSPFNFVSSRAVRPNVRLSETHTRRRNILTIDSLYGLYQKSDRVTGLQDAIQIFPDILRPRLAVRLEGPRAEVDAAPSVLPVRLAEAVGVGSRQRQRI